MLGVTIQSVFAVTKQYVSALKITAEPNFWEKNAEIKFNSIMDV